MKVCQATLSVVPMHIRSENTERACCPRTWIGSGNLVRLYEMLYMKWALTLFRYTVLYQ